MWRLIVSLALSLALPLAAGEPSPIEDSNFFPESGWNRDDAVLQYNGFVLGDAMSHELTQEWATRSPKHQLGFTIPFYSDGETGLGDVALHYRYQLFGSAESRAAIAPRVSVLLPTRSAHFGPRSSGLQVNVPLSAMLTPRLVSHTSAGATWFHERSEKEIQLTQSLAFELTKRIALSVDAAWTRCDDGKLLVIRPGVQYAFAGPRGVTVAPGIAFPMADASGVLVYVAFETPFGK